MWIPLQSPTSAQASSSLPFRTRHQLVSPVRQGCRIPSQHETQTADPQRSKVSELVASEQWG